TTWRRLAPLAALLIALGGCAIQALKSSPPTKSNQCKVSADCTGDQACEPELGVCVRTEPNALRLDLQLSPPSDSLFGREQYVDWNVSEKPAILVKLPRLVRLSGLVHVNGQSSGIRARVLFAATGAISGSSYRYETTSTENSDGSLNYSLDVKPGLTYDVVVTRSGTDLPTTRLQISVGTAGERLDIVLPAAADHWKIAGKLFWNDGTPAEGVQLQAYEIDGSRTSTISSSGTDGAFELLIPPAATHYAIRASSGPTGTVVPTLDLVELEVTNDGTNVGVVDFPKLPASISGRIVVVGRDANGNTAPLANVSLIFTSQLLGGKVQSTALSDAEGAATLTLFAGSYQITAVPPLESPFALHQQTVSLDARTSSGLQIELSPKLAVKGQLRLANGTTGLKGATMIFTLTESLSSDLAVVEGRRLTVVTNGSGAYEGQLDPGFYNVFVTPTITSGVPRKVFLSVAIDESGELPDLLMDPSAVVSGQVVDAEGNPLAGITVEAFDHANPLPFTLASGTTDEDGNFKLLVPFVEPIP
ncbi:MAG: hypothetical protein KC609_11420, partial [Myxococcales bacterium]|nr:hypothetical protein [Myxococcales bacterium]